MKKILYIHIGNHKTATTKIQQFCQKNSEKLKNLGLIYPKVGIPTGSFGHHNLAWEVFRDKRYQDGFGSIAGLEPLFNLNKTLLISSEDFESLKPNNSINTLLNIASRHEYEINIILYIRKQEELLPSLIKEITKKGAVIQNIDLLISSIIRRGYLDFLNWRFWFNYKLQIKRVTEVFKINKKNIYLLWFEKQNIIKHFLEQIFDPSAMEKINSKLVESENLILNRSMSNLSYKMLNYFNMICKNYDIDYSRYQNIKSILLDNKVFFSAEHDLLTKSQKQILIDEFKSSNASLINESK